MASKTGLPESSLNNWMRGTEPKFDAMAKVAHALCVSLDWLATGETKNIHMSLDDLQHAIEDRGQAHVPRLDVAVSAGPGSFVDQARMIEMVPFSMDFFTRRLGKGPDGMVIVDARGDSMSPTIADRDQVMIDTADTQLLPAIWAFTLDDAVLVKRLQQTPAGIQVASDNPAYAPFTIDRADADGFHLIGRVVWVGRVF